MSRSNHSRKWKSICNFELSRVEARSNDRDVQFNKTLTKIPTETEASSTPEPLTSTTKIEEKLYVEIPNYELKFNDHLEDISASTQTDEMARDVEDTTKIMLISDEISSTEQNQVKETTTVLLDVISNSTEQNSEKNSSIHTSEPSANLNKDELELKDLGNDQKLMKSDIKDVESKIENFEYEETTRRSDNNFEQLPSIEKNDYNSTSDHK